MSYQLPPEPAPETFCVIDEQSRREWSALVGFPVTERVRVPRRFYLQSAARIHAIQFGAAFRRKS